MTADPQRRELILYACPTGELARQCDGYFDEARRLGPTDAQAYPPHCTLTGFFHRRPSRADEIAASLRHGLDGSTAPEGSVEIVDLQTTPDWVGLELRSPWLETTARSLFADHRLDAGDDPIRFKRDLHLSLAYFADGVRRDLTAHAALARLLVDQGAPAGGELALWERAGRDWSRLT